MRIAILETLALLLFAATLLAIVIMAKPQQPVQDPNSIQWPCSSECGDCSPAGSVA